MSGKTNGARIARAIVAVAALAASGAWAQEVVRIGVSSPLSGPQAAYGQDNLDGARLAIDELNAKPIRLNGKTVKFELVPEDDTADPRQGVLVAQKLADGGVKFVVGPYNSGVTMPASRVYHDSGVLVATVASNPKVTTQGHPLLFRVGASDSQLGTMMARYAAQQMKAKRVAIIDDRTAYGQGVADEFAKEAKAKGLTVVAQEYTSDKATDFTAALTSIKAKKPDAVFFGGYSAQAGPMLRQMRSLGIAAPFLGGDGICSVETAKLSSGAAENVYCTQGGALLSRDARGQTFVEKYKQAYKRDALTYAVSFYDATHMIADAIQKAGSADPAKVGAVLAKGSYQGVAATYSFDDKHDLKSSPVTVYKFDKGQLVPVVSM